MINLQHELLREDLNLEEAEYLQAKYHSIIQKQEKEGIYLDKRILQYYPGRQEKT